jgi:TolB-like protein
MKKLVFLAVLVLLFAGCAEERKFIRSPFGTDALICQADYYAAFGSLPYQSGRRQQIDTVPFPGFLVSETDGNVAVDTIIGGDNIRKEIRRDDQIVSVNGRAVKNKKQFMEYVRGERFDEVVFITFKRFSGEFSLAIRLNRMAMPRMYTNFEKKLLDNKKVSIAIFPSANTSVSNPTINSAAIIEQDRNIICSAFEKTFINEFSTYPNFSIIDRTLIDKIIQEQKFQISGAVDDATIQRIGKITGASHLLFTSVVRNAGSLSFTEKLVEVETSKVVYSDNYAYIFPKQTIVKSKGKKDDDKSDSDDKGKNDRPPVIIINNNINNTNTNIVTNVNINTNNNTNTINNK